MDLPGLAAVITASGSVLVGVLTLVYGRHREKRSVLPEPQDTIIEQAQRMVDQYASIMGDIEERSAHHRVERDEAVADAERERAKRRVAESDLGVERDRRHAAEREIEELRRQLTNHEAVDAEEDERKPHQRRGPRNS